MGTEWLYGDCGTVCTAAAIRSCDGRGTHVWWPPHDKLYRGKTEEERRKEKLLYLKEKRQRLISQELPDGTDMKCGHTASLPTLISQELPDRKDMGTGDKPNPSPLFYLIQQEKIRKDKRFSDFLFIFAA